MNNEIEKCMASMLDRHERIALQLSGGRDSLACLFLFKNFLSKITVYWLNTGDAYPETLEMIKKAKLLCPNFIEVNGDRHNSISDFGLVTDLLPASCTPLGLAAGQSAIRMQDSRSCCLRVRMIPLHQKMKADGITLIIRGQRQSDKDKSPLVSGDIEDGIEYCFPIQTWSDLDVNQYLTSVGVVLPKIYDYLDSTPECLHCTGWWDMDRTKYLKVHHAEVYDQYIASLDSIKQEVEKHINHFNQSFK